MQQFIPFEDDWDTLARLRPEDLIPYRVGMLCDARREISFKPLGVRSAPSREAPSAESPSS